MSFDRAALEAAVRRHGRVVRVCVAAVRGSAPREPGAAMLVWDGGQSGTIGGGALEFGAAAAARAQTDRRVLSTHALGPDLGQCCGGSVTLLSEVYGAAELAELDGPVATRPAGPGAMPLRVRALLAQARGEGRLPKPQLVEGWMVEPVCQPAAPVWIWGAGHVGRALADVLAPLPELALSWADTAPERFPEHVPENVTPVPAADPVLLLRHAPKNASHVIVTYSHALDLALCHALLAHGFAFAGLIGSATKWARFRSRLAASGHAPAEVARITCPVGNPALGKHPQAIAVGVAAQLLQHLRAGEKQETREDRRA